MLFQMAHVDGPMGFEKDDHHVPGLCIQAIAILINSISRDIVLARMNCCRGIVAVLCECYPIAILVNLASRLMGEFAQNAEMGIR